MAPYVYGFMVGWGCSTLVAAFIVARWDLRIVSNTDTKAGE